MLGEAPIARCVVLFLLVFGLHQGVEFLINADPSLGWLRAPTFFTIALVAILFVKAEGSGFREHGFLIPCGAKRLLTISLFLAVLFVLMTLFVPGAMSMFEAVPGALWSWELLFAGGSILLASVAAETVFRGYVQTNLTDAYGFSIALITVSVMFTLYMLPITLYSALDLTEFLRQALPLFTASVFLCFLFKEARTLLCPIAFAATVTILITFTPLEATAVEYTAPVMIVTYVVLIPIMQSFVADVREQNARLEATPVVDSE